VFTLTATKLSFGSATDADLSAVCMRYCSHRASAALLAPPNSAVPDVVVMLPTLASYDALNAVAL
jgi:hypothetical protein